MTVTIDILKELIKPESYFIETGTRWGDTALKAAELGAWVWTIEIDRKMADIAKAHIKDSRFGERVDVIEGNSADILTLFSEKLKHFIILLDAHSDTESPILKELEEIAYFTYKSNTIIIDDIRVFKAGHWGITLDQILYRLKEINSDYQITYERGVEEGDVLVARL